MTARNTLSLLAATAHAFRGGHPSRYNGCARGGRWAAIRRNWKMPALDTALIVLGGIALFAAFVNGAIGYGFSSLTVPVALVFYTNRILNPAVVLIEVFVNLYVLFINLNGVPAV